MITNLIDRVKILFSKDKELASSLYKILGFYPHDIEIYRIALSHKSLAYKPEKGKRPEKPVNNERMEFLGDAILEAVVSDIVYHRYEKKREGFLTSTRSKIVQRSSLNHLATEIGLDELVRIAAPPQTHNTNIGGNAFEALFGAIYLDRGYKHCKWFIEKRILNRLVNIDDVAKREINFKSKLLEWSQKNRMQIEYTFTQHEKPGSSSPEFSSTVMIEGIVAGSGDGFSKKESHQNAAKEALVRMRSDHRFYDSLFRAKEKRTAMEVSEICVLPQIDEVEAEIKRRKDERNQGGRGAKRAPQRPDTTPIRTFTPSPKKSGPLMEEKTADKRQKPAKEDTVPGREIQEKSPKLPAEAQKPEGRKDKKEKETIPVSRPRAEEKKEDNPQHSHPKMRPEPSAEKRQESPVPARQMQKKEKDVAATGAPSPHRPPTTIPTNVNRTVTAPEKVKEKEQENGKNIPASSCIPSLILTDDGREIPFQEGKEKEADEKKTSEEHTPEKRNESSRRSRRPAASTPVSAVKEKEEHGEENATARETTPRIKPYARRSSSLSRPGTDIESLISLAEEAAYREEG